MNRSKSAVARSGGRHFLGFSLRLNVEDGSTELRLSKRSKERIDKKIRELTPRSWGQSLDDCITQLNRYLLGWVGFFHICTSNAVFEQLDMHIRRRLRAILLKHWKTQPTIAKRLIRLGVKPTNAWAAVYTSLTAGATRRSGPRRNRYRHRIVLELAARFDMSSARRDATGSDGK